MTDVYNFDGFQIPHTGIEGGMVGAVAAQGRIFSLRMSNFGDLIGGLRSDDDYKRTTLGYKSAGELQNPTLPAHSQDGEFNENPYVLGSTVKRTRNDELIMMGMGNRLNNDIANLPSFDVMSTNLADDDGTNAPKKFPSEGWSSFGKKYDLPVAYQG